MNPTQMAAFRKQFREFTAEVEDRLRRLEKAIRVDTHPAVEPTNLDADPLDALPEKGGDAGNADGKKGGKPKD